nr:RHS repeat-associated core domain-containing protein [Glycomyces mayteni]
MNGVAADLIQDGATWRLSSDTGSKVERLTGAINGDNDGEYWKVTTTDGTQYFFGRHRLPGYESGDTVSDSTWTVPVFGDDSGDECYDSTFKDAHCDQAWRWNLDWVVDPTGNAMSYYYAKETNYYARYADTSSDGDAYTRGGYLKSIQYGLRSTDAYSAAPAKVNFTVAERCIEYTTDIDCSPSAINDGTAVNWPDVPWDRNCPASQACEANQIAPTFWTRKFLTKITTQVNSTTGYLDVDSWKLDHSFVSNGDTTRSLWLAAITRSGHTASPSISLPSTELLPVQLENRVDAVGDGVSALIRPRLATVYTDLGGRVDVAYTPTDCSVDDTPSPSTNTRRCFPVIWEPGTSDGNITDWFHKYLVDVVTVGDRVGESPNQVTDYNYLGGAAWRKAKADGVTPTDERTWNDWRGFGTVSVVGAPNTTLETRTDQTYYRGMHGNLDADGNPRTVTLTDVLGYTHTDYDELSGAPLNTVVYNGAQVIRRSATDYWRHVTAEDAHSWGTLTAAFIRENTVRVETVLEDGTWLRQTADTDYDAAYGRTTTVDDFGGPGPDDDRCTRYEYADNISAHMVEYPKRVETVAVNCATVPDRMVDVIADDLTLYDGLSYGSAPTEGLGTAIRELQSPGAADPYLTTVTTAYDDFGRITKLTDSRQNSTSLVYTDVNGRNTGQTTTNDLGHTESNTFSIDRSLALTATDANGKVTEMTHDALGRLTAIWLDPQDPDIAGALPYQSFTYNVGEDAPPSVVTKTLTNDWTTQLTTVTILDGWSRTRQIQAEGPDGGRLVEDTVYDELGRTTQVNQSYFAAEAPSTTLLVADDGEVDIQRLTEYDRAGRVVTSITADAGTELWRETFDYGGDRTHFTPADGGIATTAISDARGRLVEQRQYVGGETTGAYESTKFEYSPSDQVEKVTDPAGNIWSFGYNQRGQLISSDDPDTGTTTLTYDTVGNLISTTNQAGRTVSTVYDDLNRVVSTWEGAVNTGIQLTRRVWDTYYKGQETGSVSYGNGVTTTILYGMRNWDYQVQSTKYTISGVNAGSLAGNYTFTTTYNLDGSVLKEGFPAIAGLAADGITYARDDLGRVTKAFDAATTYASNVDYFPNGQMSSARYPVAGSTAEQTFSYDDANRLSRNILEIDDIAGTVSDVRYDFDEVGNIRSIIDSPNSEGAERQAQCFTYDWQRRLSEAWTTAAAGSDASACAGGPEATGVDGAVPYWEAWEFDDSGNRERATHRTVDGSIYSDEVYAYGLDGAGPHSLGTVTDATDNSETAAFAYDANGNTTSIERNGQQQTLTWDPTGSLTSLAILGAASSTAPGSAAGTGGTEGQTDYVYDANGQRILARDSAGATLYLPSTEVRYNASGGTLLATRYLALPGGATITKTSNTSGQLQLPDHHGTGSVAIDRDTGEITRRYLDPFGVKLSERSTTDQSWLGSRGFVNGTIDPTGLTHLGAREYDPSTGRFISRDPVLNFADNQQLNGYAYSRNNPVTWTDPSGLVNYTWDHHATTLVSAWFLMPHVLESGGDLENIHTEYEVPGASKKTPGGKGFIDLLWIDETTNTVFVWEIKSEGEASDGTAEVEEYIRYLENLDEFEGYDFELGFEIYNGSSVVIPDVGNGEGSLVIEDYQDGSGAETGVVQYEKDRGDGAFHTTRPYKITPRAGMRDLRAARGGLKNVTVNDVFRTGQNIVREGSSGKGSNSVSGKSSSRGGGKGQRSSSPRLSGGARSTGPGRSTGAVRPGGGRGGGRGSSPGRVSGISGGGIGGGRGRGGAGSEIYMMY